MPQREQLTTISVVTDDDTGMHYIGEIDGILSPLQMSGFFENYGEKGKDDLLTHIAFLQYQVINFWFERQKDHNQKEVPCKAEERYPTAEQAPKSAYFNDDENTGEPQDGC